MLVFYLLKNDIIFLSSFFIVDFKIFLDFFMSTLNKGIIIIIIIARVILSQLLKLLEAVL